MALLLVLAPGGATGQPHRRGTAGASVVGGQPLGGVNVPDIDSDTSAARTDQVLARARALHARLIRVEIPWSLIEPRQQGQLDPAGLAVADHLVAQAAADGMRTVALVEKTPCWASSAPAAILRTCTPGGRDGTANAWPPRDPSAFGAFTAFLARRYGSKLAAIEIWNEPDQANERYLAGPEKVARYAELLRAAYPAVKHADPTLPVLGASIVGSNGAFLKALYAAGIKGYYDGLAVHFYNLVLASLRSIHEVQLANGDNKPLWLTEFGWSSCWPHYRIQAEQGCVTRGVQAANLANTIRALARTRWVSAEVMYELQGPAREDFGVFTETGARKPSFYALRSVLANPFGKPSPVTVHLRRRGGQLIASGSGPVGDYMQLEAFIGGRAAYRALFTMNRFNRYTVALPKALGTRNVHVSVFQYWMGTARAARAKI